MKQDNRATKSKGESDVWRKEVSRIIAQFSTPDLVVFSGTLSYYQRELSDKAFTPIVLLNEGEAEQNPQNAFDGRVYFPLQCDHLQVFDADGNMIFDRGQYINDYQEVLFRPGKYARPDMIPDGVNITDWIFWCYNGYSVKVYTDALLHLQEEETDELRLALT